MEKVLEMLDKIKSNLDKNEDIKEIKRLNILIKEDNLLLDNISKYNINNNEELRKEIINNKLYREYKLHEANINYMILDINSKLNSITKEKKNEDN